MKKNDRHCASLSDDGRYRLLVEAVTDYAIYMLDPDGVVTSWNAGALRFKGYEAAEIVGQHFSRFYTDEDRRQGRPRIALETTIRDGRFEGEGWRVRKDGTHFWAHVVIDAIRESDGTLVGFAKITRDLTERKHAEEALRLSEQRFKILLQGVTDYAIYMLDPKGIITNWNSGAERIKGYTPEEAIGEHFSRFYTAEDRENGEPQRALDTSAREGKFEKEGWRIRKDGTRFRAHVVIDPIRDDNNVIIGFAKVTRDVTERDAAQRALTEAREALFQSQKVEAIGQLTGGVAHDFNNVLMAVLSSLELMRKRLPDDPKILALLDNAVQGAERGVSLSKRMLAFARRQDLDLQAVDVPLLLQGMTDLLQRSLGPSIAIETRFPLGLAPIQADPNQLELAVLNLAVNARDAMPEGGTLTIAAKMEIVESGDPSKLKPGPYICLSVTDTGEGMDEATLARAVEPFFTTKGAGKGTGLGLPLVYGVTEQSGGRFILKSKPNEGTRAELWLPIAKPAIAAVAVQQTEPSPKASVRQLIVVAVDDDALVLMNTVAMLEDLGHKVFSASSGPRALEILRREKAIDLVITDQAMPKMTGHQLAEIIATEWPNIPVILASGFAELPAGSKIFMQRLTKPFWLDQLERAVADAIDPTHAEPAKIHPAGVRAAHSV